MVIRTNEGAQARGLLAARTKYSRSKAQHIRELCHKDVRNTAILGNYAIKSMKMSRIKGGLGEIQRFFCLLEQKNFRTTRPFCTSKKYIGAQKPQRKPASPSFYSSYSLFEFYKSALKFAWPQIYPSGVAVIRPAAIWKYKSYKWQTSCMQLLIGEGGDCNFV